MSIELSQLTDAQANRLMAAISVTGLRSPGFWQAKAQQAVKSTSSKIMRRPNRGRVQSFMRIATETAFSELESALDNAYAKRVLDALAGSPYAPPQYDFNWFDIVKNGYPPSDWTVQAGDSEDIVKAKVIASSLLNDILAVAATSVPKKMKNCPCRK